MPREQVHHQTSAYLKFMREHMAREERVVFPAAAQVLQPQDWVRLNDSFLLRDDPLFGDIVAHEFQAIADRLPGA